MSDSNQVRVSIIPESTYAVTPSSGNLYAIAYTALDASPMINTTESETIRADRMLRDIIKIGENCEGSIDAEMNLVDEAFRLMLEGAAFASRGTATAITGNTSISVTAATNTIAATGNIFSNVAVGQWLRFAGFAAAGNNGFHRVTSKTDNNTLIFANQTTFVDAAAGASISVHGQELVFPGTTEKSYTIEVLHIDTGIAVKIIGAKFDSVDFSIPTDEKVTISLKFKAKRWMELSGGSLTVDPGLTLIDSAASSVAHIPTGLSSIALMEDNRAAFNTVREVQSLEFSIANGLEYVNAVSKGIYPVRIRKTTNRITGSISEYMTSLDLIEKSLGLRLTEHQLSFLIHTSTDTNNAYTGTDLYSWIFDFPAVKYLEPTINYGGLDAETETSSNFSSIGNDLKQLRINFFPAI